MPPKFQPIAIYSLPGSFFAEEDTRELPERSAAAAVAAAPRGAFAFKLGDRPIRGFGFEERIDERYWRVLPITQNLSGRHYIGGELFTPDQIRELAEREGDPERYRILIANVIGNRWSHVIRCPDGNWQPFEEGDVIVAPAADDRTDDADA